MLSPFEQAGRPSPPYGMLLVYVLASVKNKFAPTIAVARGQRIVEDLFRYVLFSPVAESAISKVEAFGLGDMGSVA